VHVQKLVDPAGEARFQLPGDAVAAPAIQPAVGRLPPPPGFGIATALSTILTVLTVMSLTGRLL
jgi:hypothetical protein